VIPATAVAWAPATCRDSCHRGRVGARHLSRF
jgi:hypothetical protein